MILPGSISLQVSARDPLDGFLNAVTGQGFAVASHSLQHRPANFQDPPVLAKPLRDWSVIFGRGTLQPIPTDDPDEGRDYMAASRRSPVRRDQWRPEDEYRHRHHHRDDRRSERSRHDFPVVSKGHRDTESGLKIRGSAAAESAIAPSSRSGRTEEEGKLRTNPRGRATPVLSRNGKAFDRPVDSLTDREPSRNPRQRSREIGRRRSRSRHRSRSPLPRHPRHREDRRRSRSPAFPGRRDRPSPRRDRRRGRPYSPSFSPRTDHYSSYDSHPLGSGRPAADSYVPSAQRTRPRSRTPARRRRLSLTRKRSLSRDEGFLDSSREHLHDRKGHSFTSRPLRGEGDSFRPRSPNHRERSTESLRRETHRSRRQDSSQIKPGLSKDLKRPRSSVSPFAPEGNRRREGRMQDPNHPPHQPFENGIRPPSPPRPIPSFDSESHQMGGIREAFPMHGMKAIDVHATGRPGRPHIDTRQSYSTSPQWTPSSHHTSPHSGSPFSQGRGSWGGQTPTYHGQPGYVSPIVSLMQN